jgi:hypothetical protein
MFRGATCVLALANAPLIGYRAEHPSDMVRLACIRRERRGQYCKATLIERYGADQKTVDLLTIIWADCSRQQANKIPDLDSTIFDESVGYRTDGRGFMRDSKAGEKTGPRRQCLAVWLLNP